MFTQFTPITAPDESKIMLQNVYDKFGFVPNQDSILAVAPNIYKAYNDCFDQFLGKSTLGLIEGQIVILAVSKFNNSPYCIALHTWGMTMTQVPKDIIENLRMGLPLKDPKLEALRMFTIQLMENRGNVPQEQIDIFLAAGYTNQNIIEIIGGIATKTISNYLNIIAKTPIDNNMLQYAL
jgi:alkylhydroperoxidase family enzyme